MDIVDFLKNGNIAIIPTDTIYGIVGSALIPDTVDKIYFLRKRKKNKPMIILISSLKDLEKFEIILTDKQEEFLQKIWPNPISVILACESVKYKFLHRGVNSLAFRMPNNKKLLEILKQAGPLVAPSANFEGEVPAETIDEAKKYFNDGVLFYKDEGKIDSKPSTLIKLSSDGSYKILREGIYQVG